MKLHDSIQVEHKRFHPSTQSNTFVCRRLESLTYIYPKELLKNLWMCKTLITPFNNELSSLSVDLELVSRCPFSTLNICGTCLIFKMYVMDFSCSF